METILCRIGYCPHCVKEGSPHTNQVFLVYGSTTNDYKAIKASWTPRFPGFTPHIYKPKLVGENVIVQRVCAMNGCGVYPQVTQDGVMYLIDQKLWIREIYTIQQWNSLVMWKRDYQYFI